MAFDLDQLERLVAKHGHVARVAIAEVKGSSPREQGASVFVWSDGQCGTIGGGALEYSAVNAARNALGAYRMWTDVHALGPELGQCCGGVVRLVTEVFDKSHLPKVQCGLVIRTIGAPNAAQELRINRVLKNARAQGEVPQSIWQDSVFCEPVSERKTPIWVWGAGHVGRAIVQVISQLPTFDVTWVDVAKDRFPDTVLDNVNVLFSPTPDDYVRFAPIHARHLILTYSHALDLVLCDAILHHGFADLGLIGSKTKWARFKKRLGEMGHSALSIETINCPIGDPAFGKHPFEIAISVSHSLLKSQSTSGIKKERSA